MKPTPKLTWISLAVNFLFCTTLLPMILQPGTQPGIRTVFDTLLWQSMGLIAWPVALAMSFINLFISGLLPRLIDLIQILPYPLIELFLILSILGKKNTSVYLLICHILILLSFSITWITVAGGYNFMVG